MKHLHPGNTANPITLAACALLLAGCITVGPEHTVPEIPVGGDWLTANQNHDNAGDISAWWYTLGDPDLASAIERALAHNLDLRQAAQNLEASRALLLRAEALSAPSLGASASLERRHISLNSPEYNPQRAPNQTVSDAGLDASWEIDLFGALRRQRESAQASLQMSAADMAGLRLSIAAEAARTYFALRGAQRELAARKTAVADLEQILRLVQTREASGDLPRSEVERAQARLDQARAVLPGLEASVQTSAMALGSLAGDLPESMMGLTASEGADIDLAEIPVGQRADILRRRPDVISAERRLAAATADTGVATAELFPQLSLSASAGFRALGTGDLLDADSRRATVKPLLSWRILDGGRVRAEIREAQAHQKSAAIGYEKAVLSALADAEKALSLYAHSLQSIKAQQAALAGTQKVLDTTRQRYRLGDTTLADVLDAERELADQQATLAQFKTTAASNLATLYKALGGGWEAP